MNPIRFPLLVFVFLVLTVFCAPTALAGKFPKFVGDYQGTIKIIYGAVSYSSGANAAFKQVSDGKEGKLTVSAPRGQPAVFLKLKTGGKCSAEIQPTNKITIKATGTYSKLSNTKVTMQLSAVIGDLTVSGPGTLEMKSKTKLKLSGSMTGADSQTGKSVTVDYTYTGNTTD
jgi:hypothetical protein